MDEAKLQDIEARADHMTADDCTALTALVAEVRRLTAALATARREGAEEMREHILDALPCVTAERDECAARIHRVPLPGDATGGEP